MFKSNLVVPGDSPLIAVGYKFDVWKVIYFIAKEDTGKKILVFTICISTLNRLIMLPFALLLISFSCISSLYMLMMLNPTTNQVSLF